MDLRAACHRRERGNDGPYVYALSCDRRAVVCSLLRERQGPVKSRWALWLPREKVAQGGSMCGPENQLSEWERRIGFACSVFINGVPPVLRQPSGVLIVFIRNGEPEKGSWYASDDEQGRKVESQAQRAELEALLLRCARES